MLVEDEGTLAMIIKETLESQDFVIHTANDGMEGLRRFFDLRPDVVVADVMMPHLDGFEMVRRIRQTDRKTPVLFLTARSAIHDVVEGFELGAKRLSEETLRHAGTDRAHQGTRRQGLPLRRGSPTGKDPLRDR